MDNERADRKQGFGVVCRVLVWGLALRHGFRCGLGRFGMGNPLGAGYVVWVRCGVSMAKAVELSKKETLRRVAQALDTIQYGEIVIKIQGGKPVLVERREQERVG